MRHRTGQADFPHPALGQDITPSPTARRGLWLCAERNVVHTGFADRWFAASSGFSCLMTNMTQGRPIETGPKIEGVITHFSSRARIIFVIFPRLRLPCRIISRARIVFRHPSNAPHPTRVGAL